MDARTGRKLRAVLRSSLDPAQNVERPARRRGYIAELLAPLSEELPPEKYDRLAAGLTLLFGIDPIVSLRDNGDLDPKRIPDALAWVAYRLVEASLEK